MIKRKEIFDSATDNRKAWIGTPSSRSSLGAAALISSQANTTTQIYASVAVALIVALSPALFFSFGYHNDFNAWAYDTHRCCTRHPETQILMSIGRYFGAYAQNLQFWTIHSLSDLWIWRLVESYPQPRSPCTIFTSCHCGGPRPGKRLPDGCDIHPADNAVPGDLGLHVHVFGPRRSCFPWWLRTCCSELPSAPP